jgi:phosphosulfolactate phosphohydrolase-like enzyme
MVASDKVIEKCWEMAIAEINGLSKDYMNKSYNVYKKKEKFRKKIKHRTIYMVTNPELKKVHKDIQHCFTLPSLDCVYSYKTGKSARDCAKFHTDKYAIFTADISRFFPSITMDIVKHLYANTVRKSIIEEISSKPDINVKDNIINSIKEYTRYVERDVTKIMDFATSMICEIEATKDVTFINGEDMAKHIPTLDRFASVISMVCTVFDKELNDTVPILPIGTVISPNISNFVLLPVDKQLHSLCEENNYEYGRYSDNIFISSKGGHISTIFKDGVLKIINEFKINDIIPFVVNKDKTKYMPYWKHQRVLGIVVNKKTNISKRREMWFRSAINHLFERVYKLLCDVEKECPNIIEARRELGRLRKQSKVVFGNLSYIKSVNVEKYEKYYTEYTICRLSMKRIHTILEDAV